MKREAFINEILRRLDSYIWKIVRVYFTDKEMSKDAFQNILLRLYENHDKYKDKGNLKGWVAVVARNECISMIRKQNRSPLERMEAHYLEVIKDPTADFTRSKKAIDLEKALLQLNEKDRQMIILRFMKNKSIKEIDQIIGITNSAVYIKRAIIKLKKIIGTEDFLKQYDHWEVDSDTLL